MELQISSVSVQRGEFCAWIGRSIDYLPSTSITKAEEVATSLLNEKCVRDIYSTCRSIIRSIFRKNVEFPQPFDLIGRRNRALGFIVNYPIMEFQHDGTRYDLQATVSVGFRIPTDWVDYFGLKKEPYTFGDRTAYVPRQPSSWKIWVRIRSDMTAKGTLSSRDGLGFPKASSLARTLSKSPIFDRIGRVLHVHAHPIPDRKRARKQRSRSHSLPPLTLVFLAANCHTGRRMRDIHRIVVDGGGKRLRSQRTPSLSDNLLTSKRKFDP